MSACFQAVWRRPALALTLLAFGLSVAPWALAGHQDGKGDKKKAEGMQVYYLEVVTKEVDQVCAAYSAAGGVKFGKPDAGLGGARTAPMPGAGMVGVRAPLRDTEAPIVRPYWLVKALLAGEGHQGRRRRGPEGGRPGRGGADGNPRTRQVCDLRPGRGGSRVVGEVRGSGWIPHSLGPASR
jgi:uncharacterized protein